MRITFVNNGVENLGTEYLSAVLKSKGHKTSLAFDPMLFQDNYWLDFPRLAKFFNLQDRLLDKIRKSNPDLVAFSVLTYNYRWALKIARRIKGILDVPIVFGGVHPTSVPDVVIKNKEVDYVIVGEGEYALLELADKLNEGGSTIKIKNLWCRVGRKIKRNKVRPLMHDLDTLPFPDKELFFSEIPVSKTDYSIISSRGCPYMCTFCCNNVYRKIYKKWSYVRRRGVDNVIAELKMAMDRYGIKSVQFEDDAFLSNQEWIEYFSRRYKKEIDLPLRCTSVHPNQIRSNVVKSLSDAGCYLVEMGVQSTNEHIKRSILRRYETNAQVLKAVRLFKRYGIKSYVHHIFGIPLETEEDYIRAARVYNEMRPDQIISFTLAYFPRTDIVTISKREGIITDRDIERFENGEVDFYLSDPSSIENKDIISKFMSLFWILPLLPKSFVDTVIEKKLYRYIPKNKLLMRDFPVLIRSILTNDRRTGRYLRYYLYCLLNFYLLRK